MSENYSSCGCGECKGSAWSVELTGWFSARNEVGSFTGFTVTSSIHCSHTELVIATFHQAGHLQPGIVHHMISVDTCPVQALLLAFVYQVVADLTATVKFWFCPLNNDMLFASPNFFRYARLWWNSCLCFMKIKIISEILLTWLSLSPDLITFQSPNCWKENIDTHWMSFGLQLALIQQARQGRICLLPSLWMCIHCSWWVW